MTTASLTATTVNRIARQVADRFVNPYSGSRGLHHQVETFARTTILLSQSSHANRTMSATQRDVARSAIVRQGLDAFRIYQVAMQKAGDAARLVAR